MTSPPPERGLAGPLLWRPLVLAAIAVCTPVAVGSFHGATWAFAAAVAGFLLVAVSAWRTSAPALREVIAAGDAARALLDGRWHEEPAGPFHSREAASIAGLHSHAVRQAREVDARDRRFLMSISHELRTPLTAITGHAQLLADGLADDPQVRERSLAVIQQEAARLERLVGDIIDLARIRSNRFATTTESVDLERLGEHLAGIFADRLGDGLELRIDCEPVQIISDGERIVQVLRNLVGNALRYADSLILVEARRHQGHVVMRVCNDGEGIDPAIRDQLFEPFTGTKREGGMGLGLTISRELALALGGQLELAGDAGAGAETCFVLTLPLEPPGSGR